MNRIHRYFVSVTLILDQWFIYAFILMAFLRLLSPRLLMQCLVIISYLPTFEPCLAQNFHQTISLDLQFILFIFDYLRFWIFLQEYLSLLYHLFFDRVNVSEIENDWIVWCFSIFFYFLRNVNHNWLKVLQERDDLVNEYIFGLMWIN